MNRRPESLQSHLGCGERRIEMSSHNLGEDPEGATPLTDDDSKGLRPTWISTREDLNLAEAQNIADAIGKYRKKNLKTHEILDDLFVRTLHKAMYSDVWAWAGTYRLRDTSIGIAPEQISVDVVNLMGDARYWLDSDESTSIDEAVCEIHHKLVRIHPFRNGNGRMTRLFADLLLISKGQHPFSWGSGDLDATTSTRQVYIKALRVADGGDLSELYDFVRS